MIHRHEDLMYTHTSTPKASNTRHHETENQRRADNMPSDGYQTMVNTTVLDFTYDTHSQHIPSAKFLPCTYGSPRPCSFDFGRRFFNFPGARADGLWVSVDRRATFFVSRIPGSAAVCLSSPRRRTTRRPNRTSSYRLRCCRGPPL